MPHLLPQPLLLDQPDRSQAVARLNRHGYALLSTAALTGLTGTEGESLNALHAAWDTLPPDPHLKDGGRYRYRRHGSYIQTAHNLTHVPHRAHWQPTTYNALHGGMLRWFEPIEPALSASPDFLALIRRLGEVFAAAKGEDLDQHPWFIEVHPFRIDTTDGVGRPTPEGAHRDGVDYVAVLLAGRQGIRGGESRVFDAEGPLGVRFTLTEPWSALLIDDQRVIHESTPIQPEVQPEALNTSASPQTSHRDTLVITYRQHGFQDPPGV
jgi:hypothetical protein